MSDPVRLFTWPGRLLYVGDAVPASRHAHHAIQLTVALRGFFDMRFDGETSRTLREGVLVGPNVRHALRADEKTRLLLLYVDPDDACGRRLRALLPGTGFIELGAGQVAQLRRHATDGETAGPSTAHAADAWAKVALQCVSSAPAPFDPVVHPAAGRAAAFLRDHVDAPTTVAEVARVAGLSPSRLGHVFAEQIGLPMRRYKLWVRLQRAATLVLRGASVTSAAHASGFADAAHLTRTFRRMFGLAPSTLMQSGAFVEVVGPPRPAR